MLLRSQSPPWSVFCVSEKCSEANKREAENEENESSVCDCGGCFADGEDCCLGLLLVEKLDRRAEQRELKDPQ